MTRTDGFIAPSILSADFGRLAEDVARVEAAGADWIHVDVMDGHFVPNLTIGAGVTAAVRRATSLPVDVHLMVEHPERLVPAFADAGADRITVHLEACTHLHRTLQQIRDAGALPGVAINPSTPVSALSEVVHQTELVLIMSVNPGFGGQAFIPTAVRKVEETRALLHAIGRPEVWIQVDGGIDARTIGPCHAAGADVFVAGQAVYGHPSGVPAAMEALRGALAGSGRGGQGRAEGAPAAGRGWA
jgi:ribulose-phosphate 3-epimerase